jgi:hypothetical protein
MGFWAGGLIEHGCPIILNKASIDDHSKKPILELMAQGIDEQTGLAARVAYNWEYFYAIGIEESHHAIINDHLSLTDPFDGLPWRTSPLDVYLAQEHEWQALQFQLAFAKLRQLSGALIQSLVLNTIIAGSTRASMGFDDKPIPFLDLIQTMS